MPNRIDPSNECEVAEAAANAVDQLLGDLDLSHAEQPEIVTDLTQEEIQALEQEQAKLEAHESQESTTTIETTFDADAEIAATGVKITALARERKVRGLEIGDALAELRERIKSDRRLAKALKDHAEEWGSSERTLWRCLRIRDFVRSRPLSASLAEMSESVLDRLAEKEAPASAIDDLVARHEKGERITLAKVKKAFADAGKPKAKAIKTKLPLATAKPKTRPVSAVSEPPSEPEAAPPVPVENKTSAVVEGKNVNRAPLPLFASKREIDERAALIQNEKEEREDKATAELLTTILRTHLPAGTFANFCRRMKELDPATFKKTLLESFKTDAPPADNDAATATAA